MFTWLTNFGVSRFLSLVIAAAYLLIVMFMPGSGSNKGRLGFLLVTAGYLLLPLLCIWFGEEMGGYLGSLPGPALNKPTPGFLVRIGGWILLFLPIIIFFISASQ